MLQNKKTIEMKKMEDDDINVLIEEVENIDNTFIKDDEGAFINPLFHSYDKMKNNNVNQNRDNINYDIGDYIRAFVLHFVFTILFMIIPLIFYIVYIDMILLKYLRFLILKSFSSCEISLNFFSASVSPGFRSG